ncbi:MAG: glycosyltransferase [Patescibacteria group bacterium]|nr:glycosyltransferase [Patescibacteria group bacterium]
MNIIQPYLTIIVPTYNSECYIVKTLNALKNQVNQNFEILIIDDNSTDQTIKLCQKLTNSQIIIKPPHLKKGAATSLNYALKKVRTPYVALIDSDTYLAPNWVQVMIELLVDKNIIGAPILADKNNGLVAYLAGIEIESRYQNLPNFVYHLSTCNLAFRASIIQNFQFNENLFYAYDHQLSFYLKQNGIKFYLTRKTYCYHGNKNSLKKYLIQQYQMTKNHTVLAKSMRQEALSGDEISPSYLILQPIFTLSFLVFIFIRIEWAFVLLAAILLLNYQFLIYLQKKSIYWFLFPAIGLIVLRNIVWVVGFTNGLFKRA